MMFRYKHKHALRRPGKRVPESVARLAIASLTVLLFGTVFSDFGVVADEGQSIRLSGPRSEKVEVPRARIVEASSSGLFQVTRSREEEAGLVTVLTGLDCAEVLMACQPLWEGDFSEAAAAYREAIAHGQDSVSVRLGLAGSLFLDGDLLGAVKVYAWAASGYPGNPDVHNGLGNVYTELAQIDQAVEEFQEAGKALAYAAVVHNNLGTLFRRTNRLDDAAREFQAATIADPGLMAPQYNLGGTLLQLDQFSGAALAFREAAVLVPKFRDAYLYQGLSHLRAQEPVLAAVALYRARDLGVEGPALHLGLGVAAQELGLDREAERHFLGLVKEVPDDEKAYHMLAVSQVRLGKLDEAAGTLEQGFRRSTQDADAHFFLGLKLLLCRQPEKATRYLMRAVSKGRRGADTFFALGQSLLQAGELDGAIRTLTLASNLKPEASEIHFSLGIAFHYKKQNPEAIRELRTAVSLDPADLENRLALVNTLQDSGEFLGCAQEAKRLVDAFPEEVGPRYDAALCFSLAGDFDRAVELLRDALDQDLTGSEVRGILKKLSALFEGGTRLPGPHLVMATIEEYRGNWSEAIRHYELFVLTSPPDTWNRKALEKIHGLAPESPSH